MIICSDCLYEESPWEKLYDTIVFFSQVNPEVEIIFAYKKRYQYQEAFLNQIQNNYVIEEVPINQFHQEFQHESTLFHILKLKNKI